MDPNLFDRAIGRASTLVTRRTAALAAGAAALTSALSPADARRRVTNEHNVRGQKAIMCYQGQTVRKPKSQRKKWLRRGATRGACQGCTPVCAANTCGDDGCGGMCACAAGSICANGVCQVCTVTCTGTPQECGLALAIALFDDEADIYVCPGRYEAGISFGSRKANVYGAGNGDDPATSTILLGSATDNSISVLQFAGETVTEFVNMRITGGNFTDLTSPNPGPGGVSVRGATATLRNCVLTGNTGRLAGAAAVRPGFLLQPGTLTLDGCVLDDNTSQNNAGGVYVDGTLVVTDSTLSANTASLDGGGIYATAGAGITLSPDVTITANTATSGGGIFGLAGATVAINGASISGNSGGDCGGSISC